MTQASHEDSGCVAGELEIKGDFTVFYRAHYPRAMAFASLVSDAGADFEDAVGDAFLQVLTRWDTIDYPSRYLYVAIRNALRSPRRCRERAANIGDQHDRVLFLVTSAVDPDEAVEFRDVMAILQNSLTESQRIAYYLKVEAGWKSADIAEVLGCSAATVRVHLSKAYRRLRAAHQAARREHTMAAVGLLKGKLS